MKAAFTLCFVFVVFLLQAQTTISGKVTDRKGEALVGVNLYLDGTYDGAGTDTDGKFSFKTSESGEKVLVASYIGFKTITQSVNLSSGDEIVLNIVMKESSSSLGAVVITAGSFEASDEKKSVIFKPLDIVTTGGAMADIPSAINTLPGTQTVGEEGKLFVRGGDSYEVQTFIDGMIVDKPYESTTPDIPSRGRFSPFLFSGTLFSSGGYSAEYGQALSSALVLQTNGLPTESVTSLSFMSIGAGVAHTKKWKKTSLALSADYFNLSPYFALVNQDFDWQEAPIGIGTSLIFRQKTGKDGLLKAQGQIGTSSSKLMYPDLTDVSQNTLVELIDDNAYLNVTFRDLHGKKLISNAGISYSVNRDDLKTENENIIDKLNNWQARYNLTWLVSEDVQLKAGGDLWNRNVDREIKLLELDKTYNYDFSDPIAAGFVESEVKLSKRFAARAGVRSEYSDLMKESSLAPRISLAFKTSQNSQLSMAYGHFYQSPQNDFLLYAHQLGFERATHYILNWQWVKNNKTFRVEAYQKDYSELVKYEALYSPVAEEYSNSGEGYARGFDVFWRDNSRGNIDYWVSYSYIDTERNYRDYPKAATPYFVSDHNLSVVYKHYISAISSQLGFTYKFASGRPYFNPENTDFMVDRTKSYNDLSFNISYLTELWDNFTVVYFAVNNVLGFDNTFGYRYSPNPDGSYSSMAVKPGAKRFIFLGVFVSI